MKDDDLFAVLRAQFEHLAKVITEVVMPFVQQLADYLTALSAMTAQARWRNAQQAARVLSRHPDLVALDRDLDRWYTDPIWSTS